MNENRSWGIHIEFAILLITLIGGFYTLDGKIERQGERTDKLYEMFVTIQTEIKDLHGRTCIVEERNRK